MYAQNLKNFQDLPIPQDTYQNTNNISINFNGNLYPISRLHAVEDYPVTPSQERYYSGDVTCLLCCNRVPLGRHFYVTALRRILKVDKI